MNATGARRPFMLARHLADRGHRVAVLTGGSGQGDTWDADLTGIEVHRFGHGGLAGVTGPVKRALAKRTTGRGRDRGNALIRTLSFFLLPLEYTSRPFIPTDKVVSACTPPDILIATGPGWSTFEVGQRLADHWKCTYLVDYRDPWVVHDPSIALRTTTWYGNGPIGFLRRSWIRILEARYTHGIHGATAATAPLLENIKRSVPSVPMRTILNGVEPPTPRPTSPTNGPLMVLHAGRLYHEQDWESVIQVLHRLHAEGVSAKKLQVVLLGPTTEVQGLIEALEECSRRTGLLRMESRVPLEQVNSFTQDADLLLHLGFRGKKGILPLKFLEYLSADRPILQFSGERAEVEDIIDRTRTGVIVRDKDSFRATLLEAIELKGAGKAFPYRPDRVAISEYAWSERMEEWRDLILESHRMNTEVRHGR